jgi:hypothetical protein
LVQLWAKNSTTHILSTGTFNFDIDTPIGTSVQLQDIENGETCYFYEDTGGEEVPSGQWTYRVNIGKGGGGGSDPTCDITLAIINSSGVIVDTILGPDNYTGDANAGVIKTNTGSIGVKTIGATERVALIIDNVVAGARQLEVRFDGVTDDDTDIVRPQTLEGETYYQPIDGALTPSGSLAKQTSKYPVGELTSSGEVASATIFNKTIEGELTSSGAIAKQTSKYPIGELTSSGAITKQTSKFPVGELTSVGSIVKKTFKTFTGAFTPAGIVASATIFIKTLIGTLTSSGNVSNAMTYVRAFAGTLTSSGVLSGLTTYIRSFGGTLTTTGTVIKKTSTSIAGVLTSAGTAIKKGFKSLLGTLTNSGSLGAEKRGVIEVLIGITEEVWAIKNVSCSLVANKNISDEVDIF